MSSIRTRNSRQYRQQKIVFHFVAEGEVTEIDYLRILQNIYTNIVFDDVGRSQNNPISILNVAKRFEKSKKSRENDYMLILMDRDSWEEKDVERIWKWENYSKYRVFVFSNQCFELWLIRHYNSEYGASTAGICHEMLKRVNPALSKKRIPLNTFTKEDMQKACKNARCANILDWKQPGFTNAYKLIEILDSLLDIDCND